MTYRFLGRLLAVPFAVGLLILPAPPAAEARSAPESFADLVDKLLPAVVNIATTTKITDASRSDPDLEQLFKQFFDKQRGNNGGGDNGDSGGDSGGDNGGDNGGGDNGGGDNSGANNGDTPHEATSLGSGFIIDPEGHIVTNNHVIGDAGKVEVILQDKSRYTAKIVGRDPKTDIAVLKIKADQPLPYVSFGDSSAAQVGDWVMAVGNPFGLGGTVTTGIISARGRDINEGPYDDFLQIDAPINRGNSGGPTFNLDGQVIGINTAIYSPNGGSVGIGFAVPSNVAKPIVDQLIAHGKITRGWLGVQIQEVTPAIAASLGLKGEHGALVALVTPDGPAAKAGLKQGDVILSFDGHEVGQLHDLPRLVADAAPGSEATVTVWRDGHKTELQAKLGELPDNNKVASAAGDQGDEPAAEASASGMHFAPLTNRLRQQLHVGKNVEGVVVTRVDNGSAADDSGLSEGDVIVSIDQQPVHTPAEAAAKLHEAAHSAKKTALVLLNRHGTTQYVGLNLGSNQG